MNKAVICNINSKPIIFFLEDMNIEMIEQFPNNTIDNIYLARITNNIGNMNAAFISLGDDEKGYLRISPNIKGEYKNGDIVIAQRIKDEYANKLSTFTNLFTIYGNDILVRYGEDGYAVSNKIKEEKKIAEFKCIYNKNKRNNNFVLFRSSAINKDIKEIERDLLRVYKIIDDINNEHKFSNNPRLIYTQEDRVFRKLKDIKVIVENKNISDMLPDYISHTIYEDNQIDIRSLYGINSIIKKLKNRKVHLDDGSNIVIDKTEALTVIDVNSAKAMRSNKGKVTKTDVNINAAYEIMKQIKLRNISGIIMVDFVNMKYDEDREKIINILNEEAREDDLQVKIMGFTKLGLLEMTRKREKQSLMEYLEWN